MRAVILPIAALALAACAPAPRPAPPETTPSFASGRDALTLGGGQFLAVSVANLEASRRWYQRVFGLTPLLDATSPDSSTRTMILGSDALVVELSAHRAARSLRDYAGTPTPTFLMHGFFKGGLFVTSLDTALAVLRERAASLSSDVRADTTSRLRFVFLRDPDGNYLQLLERGRVD
ncbi:MAG: VOC family protein [Gemmatimonadaceae bacterium]